MTTIRLPADRSGFTAQLIGPSDERPRGRPIVLLVHGASASSNTFLEPEGGLRRYLENLGWAVYSLDWRSSMLTVPALVMSARSAGFTLDDSADDLQRGLARVCRRERVAQSEVAVVGHCVGGGLVAQAIARHRGDSPSCPFLPKRIVLTTLALFWKVGVEGWLKGTDFVVDDLRSNNSLRRVKDNEIQELTMSAGDRAWAADVETRFDLWLRSGFHHGCGIPFCQRMAFMYGMPFRLDDMEYLHNAKGLSAQFGHMPLGIYVHCLQNLRRGWAAPYGVGNARAWVNRHARDNFAGKRITLITGNENQVWHRDGIDRMYEWLTNGKQTSGLEVVKHVLPKYGHQDLYWSTRAVEDVYPKILAGITR